MRDAAQCARDATLMKTLGTNSIRVYHVQPEDDHDACMKSFADAGIYVWLDLDDRDSYILPDGSNTPSWTEAMMAKYEATMDAFEGYDNLAGVFIGNEMLTTGADSAAAPYLKAAARDMKAYRDKQGYRQFPVGYSAADIPDLRPNLQNYLACGTSDADRVDFYSLNVSIQMADAHWTLLILNRLMSGAESRLTKSPDTPISNRTLQVITFQSSFLRQGVTSTLR